MSSQPPPLPAPGSGLCRLAALFPLFALVLLVLEIILGIICSDLQEVWVLQVLLGALLLAFLLVAILTLRKLRRYKPRPPQIDRVILSMVGAGCVTIVLNWLCTGVHVSQEAARSAMVSVNVREIAQNCLDYADRHQVCLPPHLAALLYERRFMPNFLIDPSSGSLPLDEAMVRAASSWDALVPAVDAHCDYVYLGGDLPASATDNPALILVYSKIEHWHFNPDTQVHDYDAFAVGFMDTHVETLRAVDLSRLLEENNAWRVEHSIAPVPVKLK